MVWGFWRGCSGSGGRLADSADGGIAHARLWGIALGTAVVLAGTAFTALHTTTPADSGDRISMLEHRVRQLEMRRGSVPISQEADDRLTSLEDRLNHLERRVEALEGKR